MKVLFSSRDGGEVRRARRRLTDAGIRCRVRQNPIAQGLFGLPACPELWLEKDCDLVKALRLLGGPKLQQVTVVIPAQT